MKVSQIMEAERLECAVTVGNGTEDNGAGRGGCAARLQSACAHATSRVRLQAATATTRERYRHLGRKNIQHAVRYYRIEPDAV